MDYILKLFGLTGPNRLARLLRRIDRVQVELDKAVAECDGEVEAIRRQIESAELRQRVSYDARQRAARIRDNINVLVQ